MDQQNPAGMTSYQEAPLPRQRTKHKAASRFGFGASISGDFLNRLSAQASHAVSAAMSFSAGRQQSRWLTHSARGRSALRQSRLAG